VKADARDRERLIDDFDRGAERLGREILGPRIGEGIIRAIRAEESDDVRHVIRSLKGAPDGTPAAGGVLGGGQRA
jgi:hypothetical protein